MDNEIEIWKDVGVYDGIDYTGMYEVSTFGNFKSLDRVIIYKNGQKGFVKEKLKTQNHQGQDIKQLHCQKMELEQLFYYIDLY